MELEGIKKLAMLVPMRGKVDCIFMQTYLSLFIHLLKKRNIVAQPVFGDQLGIDVARNAMTKTAIINRSDYALYMDSDIVVGDKMFEHLWETLHEKDGTPDERFIVSGIYYEREIPYDAVIRNKNELGIFEKIMEFPDDKPFTCDGVGFGMVLMKMAPVRAAFAHTMGYPFQFTRRMSEDLFFCDLMGNGQMKDPVTGNPVTYKIWVDPRVQIPHHGAYVTQWHHLHYKLDEYHDISELAKYLGIRNEECFQKCTQGALNMCKAWQDKFGKDKDEKNLPEAEIMDFYRNTDIYLYDLTWYWSHNRKSREDIMNKYQNWERVLDYGCGIGDYGLAYAEEHPDSKVDFYDVNKANLAYLRHRIKIREEQGIVKKGNLTVYGEGELPDFSERYDSIFCFDVLEHLKQPGATASLIRKMLKKDGLLLAIVSPKGVFQPQHIAEIDLNQHGFLQTDIYSYVRDDSDMAIRYAKVVNNIKESFVTTPMKRG
jgi:2-polyprenyl-3-methyl-5-hydroxy-6-metoxy-1,4-benzoquinol methylase